MTFGWVELSQSGRAALRLDPGFGVLHSTPAWLVLVINIRDNEIVFTDTFSLL